MRPNRNGGIPPPIPKPRRVLYAPHRIQAALDEIKAMAAAMERITQELKPCLGRDWIVKSQRLRKTLLRFHATTSRHYLEMRKKASAAEFSEIPFTPTEHIKTPAVKSFEAKNTLPIPNPRSDDAVSRLFILEDAELRRDAEKKLPQAKTPAAPVEQRRRTAYIPGLVIRRDW